MTLCCCFVAFGVISAVSHLNVSCLFLQKQLSCKQTWYEPKSHQSKHFNCGHRRPTFGLDLASILAPMVGNTPYHISNPQDIVFADRNIYRKPRRSQNTREEEQKNRNISGQHSKCADNQTGPTRRPPKK